MERAASPQSLRHLGPGIYSIVMGLGGLALAWHRATPTLGRPAEALAVGLGVLAALVYAVLAVATLLRALRHADAWAEDRRHPVRHTFVATLPIATMLLATIAVALDGPSPLAALLWWAGSLGQFAVTVWVLGRWWEPGGLPWASATPALFIPVVGNVLAPLAGVPLGYGSWATAQFGVGLLFWPVIQTLLAVRVAVHGPWPDRMRPASFIVIAPPAVVGLAAAVMGAPVAVLWMCWGLALFTFLWAGVQARTIAALPFGLPHWGMSFPLTAITALTLRIAGDELVLVRFGLALLALATLVIASLVAGTLRSLRAGTLLVAEAAPSSPPARG